MVGRDIPRYLSGLIVGGPSLLAPELADDWTRERRSTRPQIAQVGPIRFRSRGSLWPRCEFTANMNSCSGNRTNIRPQLDQREVVLADA